MVSFMNQEAMDSAGEFLAQLQSNYDDIRVINTSGGGGVIYAGIHRRLGVRVVLKKIRSEHLDTIGSRREMEILLNLKHTYLPQIFDFWQHGNDVFTVMEYIEGKSLKELLDSGMRFSEAQVIRLTRQLAEVLAYLHSAPGNIVHSDIKPANIMLTPQGNICLIDFNVSTLQNGAPDETIGYTPGYAPVEQLYAFVRGKQNAHFAASAASAAPAAAAPAAADPDKTYLDPEDVTYLQQEERTRLDAADTVRGVTATAHPAGRRIGKNGSVFAQLEDAADLIEKKYGTALRVDARSDIYSACATMFHLLTGHRPLSAEKKQLPIEKLVNVKNDAFADILRHGMEENPDRRFATAEQMLSALNRLAKSTKRYRRMRRGQDLAVIFVVVLFAASAAAFWTGGQRKIEEHVGTALTEAQTLYHAGQYEEVVSYLNEEILERPYIQSESALGETYYMIGSSYLQRGEYAAAAEHLRTAVFYEGGNSDYYRDYGIALVRSGNVTLAEEALRQAKALGVSDAGLYLLTGEIAAAGGSYEEGINAYEHCLEALGSGAEANADALYAHALLGYDDMLEVMAPDDIGFLRQRVEMLRGGLAKMTQNAYRVSVLERLAQAAVACGSADADAAYLETAISAYREIIDSGYATMTEWLNLAVCHQSIGQYEEAKTTLTEALGRYPDRYEVHMRLAFLEIDIQYEKPLEERNYSAFRTYAGEAIRIWRALPEDVEDPDIEYLYRTAEEVVGKLWLAGL